VQKGKYKIGIIGAIGSELESSIATNRIAPYEFKDSLPYIKEYSKKLRTELGCTLVVLAMHDNTTSINQTLADLKDEYQIDAVFNGHTHSTYAAETLGNDGIVMPYIQSGSSGSSIGKITLTYNKTTKKVEQCSSENITVNKNLSSNNSNIDKIVNEYNEKISVISEEVIGVAGSYIDRITGARWAVNVIRDYSGCQIGFINSGGIRQAGFPIEPNQNVTVGKIWEIMPFDNFVKTCTMTTQQVIRAYNLNDILHSDNVEVRNGKLYYNGQECSDDQTFTAAAVDYIFDKTEYPFLQAQNPQTTGELFRDYLIQAVKDQCKNGDKWNG
jgi:2',3'-cyclic-nucleotide 2'-phosphodiesterase (5'-nucleotidase family)